MDDLRTELAELIELTLQGEDFTTEIRVLMEKLNETSDN